MAQLPSIGEHQMLAHGRAGRGDCVDGRIERQKGELADVECGDLLADIDGLDRDDVGELGDAPIKTTSVSFHRSFRRRSSTHLRAVSSAGQRLSDHSVHDKVPSTDASRSAMGIGL
jgi:hypothetical protein